MARFRGVGPPAGATPGATTGGGGLLDIAAFRDALSGIVAPLQSFQSTIKDVAAGFLLFKSVSLAAPGTMNRFNIALQDSTAVIGQRLAPVFEQVLIPAVKLFGDFLTTILPSADDFAEVLSPITDFLGELRKMLTAVAPVIKDVLIVGLKALGEALKLVLWPFRVLFQFIEEVFGVQGAAKLGSAAGSTARNIRFEDPLAAVKSVYQAAFQARGGPEEKKKTPLEKIDDSVRAAVDWLKKIFGEDSLIGQVLKGIAGVVKSIYDAIPKEVKDEVGKFFDPDEGAGAAIGQAIADVFVPGNKYQPPEDVGKAALTDIYAKATGRAARVAGQVGEQAGALPFGQLAVPGLLKEMLENLKKLGEKAGVKDVQGDIDRILNEARRRAMDGHPGGA
jgi:hypothetical protein